MNARYAAASPRLLRGRRSLAALRQGNEPAFALSNDTCTAQTLAPSDTCTFDLSFTSPFRAPGEVRLSGS